ncbi:protein tyrosine phosphatase, putative [Babesia caballi]|uniref:Protein tyrosine phosphatase, putative n=1 Tax=Babesia caballi TaxID=5871 RepID=A0AAV4LQD3_BABCB|nr:protein tyrosine phosphatase, putative [Babesia caballi]
MDENETSGPSRRRVCGVTSEAELQQCGATGPADVDERGAAESQAALLDSEKSAKSRSKTKMEASTSGNNVERELGCSMLFETCRAILLFGIVCVCYVLFQYIQELLMRFPILDEKKFDFPVFLAFLCFATNLVTTCALLGVMQLRMNLQYRRREDPSEERQTVFDMFDRRIMFLGFLAAVSNVVAMLSSHAAVKYVGVPTQIVIKSAKMIPILIGGLLIFKKTYPMYDYVTVCVITLFIFIFNFFKPNARMAGENTTFGLVLCLMSLACDGFTGPIEDRMLALKDLHPFSMLFILNFFGFPFAAAAAFIFEGTEPFCLLRDNPELWKILLLLSVTASVGQVFIVICLKLYGSLYTTLITTIRKIVSSLLSIFMFHHPMSVLQWISMAGTFLTLFARQYFKYQHGLKKKQAAQMVAP